MTMREICPQRRLRSFAARCEKVELRTVAVTEDFPDSPELQKILDAQFPVGQRPTVKILCGIADSCFSAYYHGQTLIGLSATLDVGQTTVLLYLAVRCGMTGRGFGTEILRLIKRRRAGRIILLCVEDPDDTTADNLEQRHRRVAFYGRQGFVKTARRLNCGGLSVSVLSNGASFPCEFRESAMRVCDWLATKMGATA